MIANCPPPVKVGPTVMYLGRGDTTPAGGALRRVAEVVRRAASGERDYVVRDARRLDLPGLAPGEAGYVVTLEGKGGLEGHNVEVRKIKGCGPRAVNPTARGAAASSPVRKRRRRPAPEKFSVDGLSVKESGR
jgi:hypothetical protein